MKFFFTFTAYLVSAEKKYEKTLKENKYVIYNIIIKNSQSS
jgi:hypothetical protein